MSQKKNKNDCYSQGERGFMQWGQDIRAQTLQPLLQLLSHLGIKANHISIVSLVIGLLAAVLFIYSKPIGLLLLFLHVLLDGLDGPLARHTKTDSNQGSFTDSVIDQVVIVAMMVSLVFVKIADPVAAIIYLISYTVVVSFAFVRNALHIPYSWLFRPRFLIYVWIPVELWLLPGTLDILIWICNLLLVIKSITGFIKIRRKI